MQKNKLTAAKAFPWEQGGKDKYFCQMRDRRLLRKAF
jgi:hypothetical protein